VQGILLPIALGVAFVVVLVAIIRGVRAAARARGAAALVSQLLEPVEVADFVEHVDEVAPSEARREPVRRVPPLPTTPATRDANAVRIPVLDLDRLRTWLTERAADLGRVAVVSVELDEVPQLRARVGDAATARHLEAVSARLRTLTRPHDVVAYVNDERFVLVCRDVPDRDAAEALGERIALGVAHPSVDTGGVTQVTASIGVAIGAPAGEVPQSVLRRAIEAGKVARTQGGARVHVADARPGIAVSEGELATSIAREELRMHYLPIVSCATGRVAGFEALVRWEHARRGLLPASEFVGAAEQTGAILAIGNWALEQACRQLAAWHGGGGGTLKLNANVSARQFAEPTFPARVERMLHDASVSPGDLWLEITEATLLHDREVAELVLGQLHDIGVKLVIDDFGSGASSLVSLKRYPIEAIKIDHSFVAGLGSNAESAAICNAIVDLAHSLRLCTIAEGVETLEQFAALRSLGCELAQGHLLGAARPAEEWGAAPSSAPGVVRGLDAS
jgi:EAL domain-containing protein (putative c-di-GMP-specific phosphodiesterase class I)/GGDEF domain-containing protein